MRTNFTNLRTTRIGKAGEDLAQKHFTAKGFYVYRPPKGKSHLFDMVLVDKDMNITFCEVKTYPKRFAYNDTGVDEKDWRTLCKAYQKQLAPVWIVFIDVTLKQMYYFEMNDALMNAAQTDAGKTYFPLSMSKVLIPVIGDVSMAKLRTAAAYTPKVKQPITF